MKREIPICPNGHGPMKAARADKKVTFRGITVNVAAEQYRCPACGLGVSTVQQSAAAQKALSDAYRKRAGLLTGQQIADGRKKLGLTQEELADRANIGIASIKRWEGTTIQSRSMDRLLRTAIGGEICGDPCSGNRPFSVSRIKLVLRQFETKLGRSILKKGYKMLFASKYAWYADAVAFRETGQSMTGATYAALPYGPQLNNYKDLLIAILKADEAKAEPLTVEEERIIQKIARTFPRDRMIYDAAHREPVWKEKETGAMIPYSDSARLKEI
jgi:putative zinc finger/helix-turn-helix YgiT family protein